MGKTGLRIAINESEAQIIIRNYSKDERYLRNLVSRHMPEIIQDVDRMNYRELLHHGYVIKGIAQKLVKYRVQKTVGIERKTESGQNPEFPFS